MDGMEENNPEDQAPDLFLTDANLIADYDLVGNYTAVASPAEDAAALRDEHQNNGEVDHDESPSASDEDSAGGEGNSDDVGQEDENSVDDTLHRLLDEDEEDFSSEAEGQQTFVDLEVGQDFEDDHFLGGVKVSNAAKRQKLDDMAKRKKGTTLPLGGFRVVPGTTGAASSSSSRPRPEDHMLLGRRGPNDVAANRRSRLRGLGHGQFIAGGYVSKQVVESPEMQAMMKKANKEYFGGQYAECKQTIKEITTQMGAGIVSRDVYMLLANVHEKEGQEEKALTTKYYCLTRLGGINLEDYKTVIAAMMKNKKFYDEKKKEILTLCKKCVASRLADAEVYTTIGNLFEKQKDLHSACNQGYLRAFAVAYSGTNRGSGSTSTDHGRAPAPSSSAAAGQNLALAGGKNNRATNDKKAAAAAAKSATTAASASTTSSATTTKLSTTTSSKQSVDAAGTDAARVLFSLGRWDDCVRILELTAERSLEVGGKISDNILLLFGEVLCLHLRDFRRCVSLFFRAWGLARTGDSQTDAVMIGPGRVIRRVFGQKDLVRLSWLAIALIELGRYDEVDETQQYHRGSTEAECAICVEAVNSIVDRTSVEDIAGESILHNVVDALLGQEKVEAAHRLLQKFVVADRVSAKTRERLGQCCYLEKDYENALKHFEQLLDEVSRSEETGVVIENEMALRVQLAEIYVLTKNSERFGKVLSSDLTYANLKSLKKLPAAMSRGDRDQSFRELWEALQKAWELHKGQLAAKAATTTRVEQEKNTGDDHEVLHEGFGELSSSTTTKKTPAARAGSSSSAGAAVHDQNRRKNDKIQVNRKAFADHDRDFFEVDRDVLNQPNEEEFSTADSISTSNLLPQSWLSRFVYLVNDCELDNDRAQTQTTNAVSALVEEEEDAAVLPVWRTRKRKRDNKKAAEQQKLQESGATTARRRVLSIQEKRKLLALEGIEDIYGMGIWLEFVRFGCEFAVSEIFGRPDLGVDLLETVIHNRRAFLGRSKAAARGIPELERTSMQLALLAQRSKIAFRYIRKLAVDTQVGTVNERVIALLGRLLASSELAFDARRELSSSLGRDRGETAAKKRKEKHGAEVKQMKQAASTVSSSSGGAQGGLHHSANRDHGGATTTADGTTSKQSRKPGALTDRERNACISDYQKWASRHLCANPKSWGLMMLVGHCSCMSGRSRYAAKEYARAAAECPLNPLTHLCLGANLLSTAMSRTTNRRHAEVLRGWLALRKYQELRRSTHEAETWYNVGRGHHLLGILKFAMHAYRKCLECLDSLGPVIPESRVDLLALQRSCAHNLRLLFCHAGNLQQAESIAKKYLAIV
ncbi:unnamed protein product [Amoebophrya sp. A120]|nr:unnamed protein product [Amoebophrya sp. A120]|eukprot:GSA120T00011061001.1